MNISSRSASPGKANIRVERVVYQIFADAAVYATDEYWQELLQKAACNKFPSKYITYTKGKLVYTYKKKNDIVSLQEHTPAEVADIFTNFIRQNLSVTSSTDIEKSRRMASLISADTVDNMQCSIDDAICYYAGDNIELRSAIYLGIYIDCIQLFRDDDGRIINIDGLSHNGHRYIYTKISPSEHDDISTHKYTNLPHGKSCKKSWRKIRKLLESDTNT